MTSNATLGLIAAGDNGITMIQGPSQWNLEDAGSVMRLNAVYTAADGEVYAAGLNRIYHRSSTGWVAEKTNAVEYFDLGGDAGHLYAVGGNGTLLERSGSTWNPVSLPQATAAALHGVGLTPTDTYIVGSNGAVITHTNDQWSVTYIGNVTLWDVMPLADASFRAVAVGANGVSYGLPRDDATSWLPIETHVPATLYSLAFGPGGNLYAAGDNGTLLVLDDINWTQVVTPTTRPFLNAWNRDGALFLCGGTDISGGMLFRYGP
jgi:hypothetical protein